MEGFLLRLCLKCPTRTHNIRKIAASTGGGFFCSRARPLPAHDEMVTEDLTPDAGAEFLAALEG